MIQKKICKNLLEWPKIEFEKYLYDFGTEGNHCRGGFHLLFACPASLGPQLLVVLLQLLPSSGCGILNSRGEFLVAGHTSTWSL